LEDYLSFIEFAYNRSVQSTIGFSPFEIVYGFNPLTLMDLIHLPVVDERSVRQQIEKRNHVYATKANKGHKHVIFQPGD
jgi:hypothetical protein